MKASTRPVPELAPVAEAISVAFVLERERRAEFWAATPEALFDRPTVAAVLYVQPQTLEISAIKGGGIPYRRISRRVYYRKADVLAWIEARSSVVTNTAQAHSAGVAS